MSPSNRLWLVLLARRVKIWEETLRIFQPDTLLRWHRQGFRLFWTFKWPAFMYFSNRALSLFAFARHLLDDGLWHALAFSRYG